MSLIATAFGTKVAIAALSLVALGGGTAVAVATANGALQALPVSVQTDAPTATPDATATATADPTATPTPTPSPSATKGPDATGPAAFGLCTAYTAGGLHNTSKANAVLVTAAQSAGSIEAYCAPILEGHGHGPSKSKSTTPSPTSDAPTVHGKSGTAHGKASSSGSDGH
ncbi:MAG: hypothetical protein QOH44_2194 [Actinomycetota bacterium]|jgi:hypothetical protein|nr:hypothetical protein [Actinomycetota bacterium]